MKYHHLTEGERYQIQVLNAESFGHRLGQLWLTAYSLSLNVPLICSGLQPSCRNGTAISSKSGRMADNAI